MSQAQVEGVLEVLLVVGTTVKDNGEGLGGVDTGRTGVKSELSDLKKLVSVGLAGEFADDLQRYRHR